MSIPLHLQAAPATTKEGISLNKEGVASPAEIKIRSVKEGGKANPKRLQLITLSSPSSKDKKPTDNTSAPGVENHKQESAVVDVEKKRVALTPVEPQKVRFRLFDLNFWLNSKL